MKRTALVQTLALAVVAGSGIGVGWALSDSSRPTARALPAPTPAPTASGAFEAVEPLGRKVDALGGVLRADTASVTVTGEAAVAQKLRGGRLTFQIGASRATVSRAVEAAQADIWGVQAALTSAGVSGIEVAWLGAYRNWPSGYSASARVTAEVTRLAAVDGAIERALKGRGAEVTFVGLSFATPANAVALDSARREAIADAAAAARAYAALVGRKLGAVVSVEDRPQDSGGYESGYPELEVRVAVTYRLI